jgi:cytochrome b involved in lipid metabolism
MNTKEKKNNRRKKRIAKGVRNYSKNDPFYERKQIRHQQRLMTQKLILERRALMAKSPDATKILINGENNETIPTEVSGKVPTSQEVSSNINDPRKIK